jgi:hypothetical protein
LNQTFVCLFVVFVGPCFSSVEFSVLYIVLFCLSSSCVSYLNVVCVFILSELWFLWIYLVVFISWFCRFLRINKGNHHFFRNACTKSGSLRFSQFFGC